MPQSSNLSYGRPADDGECGTFARMAADALFFPCTDLNAWFDTEGRENIRLVKHGAQVVGGLTYQRMGQWFGGRSVPMAAVRVVAVSPEHRAAGAGTFLIRSMLQELAAEGLAISTLFPATLTVYRRPGYEQAGVRLKYRLSTASISVRAEGATMRRLDPAEFPALHAVYAQRARHSNGNLDRSAWAWRRMLEPPPWLRPAHVYVVERDGKPEGYLAYALPPGSGFHNNMIEVNDMVALTAEAGRRMLAFLADHRSVAPNCTLYAAPIEPLFGLLREQQLASENRIDWMLRIVDVTRALEARGYPSGIEAALHLSVTDDLFPANHDRFILEVSSGRGQVSRGGRGELRIDIRGLASLYSAYLSAESLNWIGLLEGSDEAKALATAIFAGPVPWMADGF